RGHGESGGDYYGFGWHDRLDIIDWLDQLVAENPDAEIVLHGLSMGAATVLMASGEDLPENVRLIIADSPYTSVYDLFAYQLEDRKSTRLNSSHVSISYAVFCLKKKICYWSV